MRYRILVICTSPDGTLVTEGQGGCVRGNIREIHEDAAIEAEVSLRLAAEYGSQTGIIGTR